MTKLPEYIIEQDIPSVVLVGAFSPQNFTPEWLHHFGLISETVLAESKISVISRLEIEVALPWAEIHVKPTLKDRSKLVMILTDNSESAIFKDLVTSLFNLNETCVVTALGINTQFITNHHDLEKWHALGHKLVPKEIWRKAVNADEKTDIGMNSLSVKIERKLEAPFEHVEFETNVEIAPISMSQKDSTYKTRVTVNNHFEIARDAGMQLATQLWNACHDQYQKNSRSIIENILNG